MSMARVRTSSILMAFAALAAACSGSGDDGDANTATPTPPALTVRFVLPAASAPDPFPATITKYVITLQEADGTVVVTEEFGANDPLSIPGVDPIAGVILVLEGFDASDALVSRGRTLLFDLTNEDGEISMYFSRVHEFSDVSGPYVARAAQAVLPLTDGRVLIAGGIAPGTGVPLASASVYDPATDTLAPTASLGTALAFPAAIALQPDVLLLAGGIDGAGNESASAQVYVYDPVSHTGAWSPAVNRMGRARADHGGAPLGGGQALVMGGRENDGLPSPTWERFTWNGTTGTWSSGVELNEEHLGAIAIGVGGGDAFAGGGFENDVTIDAIRDSYVFDGASFGSPNNLAAARGWPGVVQLDTDEWLLFGGLAGTSPGTAVASTERLVWNGSPSHPATDDALSAAQRRGGGGLTAHGEILIIGGDTSQDGEPIEPVDAVRVFDPATGTFTNFGKSPGPTVAASVVPLPDGTTLVVTDGKVTRYNPRP